MLGKRSRRLSFGCLKPVASAATCMHPNVDLLGFSGAGPPPLKGIERAEMAGPVDNSG